MIFSKTHSEPPKTMDEIFDRAAALTGECKAQVQALIDLGNTKVVSPGAIALGEELVPSMKLANQKAAQMEKESPASSPNLTSNKP